MSEYRRFVAYFYEYIDGKKQKNTGFAKVELRNGMWRILFHLMMDTVPEEPIQVYGFVRENDSLTGFRLGTMPAGRELGEEWAYHADALIGCETYSFADLSGIWIRSGDGREFITVWDDEGVDVKKFIPEVSERYERTEEEKKTEDKFNAENTTEEASVDSELVRAAEVELKENNVTDQVVEDILRKRKKFSPFADDEISDCVQMMPCDLVRLQQEKWCVGRSSFLQHGFYQYRHLLLGKTQQGGYVIGVPGENNPQERCMAELFGYKHFKCSYTYACGKKMGYWYRTLMPQPDSISAT